MSKLSFPNRKAQTGCQAVIGQTCLSAIRGKITKRECIIKTFRYAKNPYDWLNFIFCYINMVVLKVYKKFGRQRQRKVQLDSALLGRRARIGDPRSRRFTLLHEDAQGGARRDQVRASSIDRLQCEIFQL